MWAELSRGRVPGFAGIFVDDERHIVVSATEAASEPQALQYAREWRMASRDRNAPIRFRQVEFSAEQLGAWHASLVDLLDDPRILWTDAHEQSNRVLVGVTNQSAMAALRDQITARGIPDEALVLTESGIQVEARDTTLWDKLRPVRGGLRIDTADAGCTHGFNTEYNGEPAFVTNSHCSVLRAAADSTVYTQPNSTTGTRIGFEVADPTPFTGSEWFHGQSWPCGAGTGCRFSDAQVSEYYDSIDAFQGWIARTTAIGIEEEGSRVLDSPSYDRIVDKWPVSGIYVGLEVEMMGMNSGWTGGEVTNTCITIGRDWVELLCQFRASYYSWDGDSGGPVFVRFPDSDVGLVGINHGYEATAIGFDTTWDASVFSSLSGIEADLGTTLDVCITSGCTGGPVLLSLEGPEAVPTNEFCEWEADASGGTPPYTYEWYIDDQLQSGETNSNIVIPVGTESFTLAVIVTDDIDQGNDEEIQVDVDSQNPSCTS